MSERNRLIPLLLAAAAVILLQQAIDFVALLPGSDLAVPAGRLRQLLALESHSFAAIAADLLLIWCLLLLERKRALRGLGTAHWVVAVLLVLSGPLFLRDAATLAAGFAGAAQSAFRVVVARMLGILMALGLLAAWAGSRLRDAGARG